MWFGQTRQPVTALAFAPDGRTLYTGGESGELRAWDLVSQSSTDLPESSGEWGLRKWVADIWPVGGRLMVAWPGAVNALDLGPGAWAQPLVTDPTIHSPCPSPDGRLIVDCGGGTSRFWDARTHRPRPVPAAVAAVEQTTVNDFSADGTGILLYSSTTGRAWLWDVAGRKMRCELDPPPKVINPWSIARDGRTAAISCYSKVLVYDLLTGKRKRSLSVRQSHLCLALDPSGRTLAVATTAAQGVVALWDAEAGRQRERFAWGVGNVSRLAFSPDGLTCAAGSRTGVVVWDVGG